MEALYWLIAAGAFLVLEIITMGLTTIWFAGGALVAAIFAMLLFPLGIQIAVFVIVSAILLLVTRPLANHFINNKTERTNVDSLIGQRCLVTKEINNLHNRGQVTIKGQEWSARSLEADQIIPQNAIVKVESISGVKVIVSIVTLPQVIEEKTSD